MLTIRPTHPEAETGDPAAGTDLVYVAQKQRSSVQYQAPDIGSLPVEEPKRGAMETPAMSLCALRSHGDTGTRSTAAHGEGSVGLRLCVWESTAQKEI